MCAPEPYPEAGILDHVLLLVELFDEPRGDAIEVVAYRNADKAFATASVSVGGGVQLNNTYQKS